MKFKTTKKAVMNGYSTVINGRNGLLFNLLRHEDAVAYTERAEGWAADVYAIGNTAIVTGYAPFGNVTAGYATCKKYDDAAKEIFNSNVSYVEKELQTRELLQFFIDEIKTL